MYNKKELENILSALTEYKINYEKIFYDKFPEGVSNTIPEYETLILKTFSIYVSMPDS